MTSTREEKIREEKNDDPIGPENLVKYQDQLREIRTIAQTQIPNTRDPARIAVEIVINTLEYMVKYVDGELDTRLKEQLTQRKEKAEGKRERDPTYLYMPTLKDKKQAIFIHTDGYFKVYDDSMHFDCKDDSDCIRFVKQAMFSSLVVDFIRLFEVAKKVNRVHDFCAQLDSANPKDPLHGCLDIRIRTGEKFIDRITDFKFSNLLEEAFNYIITEPTFPITRREGYFSYFVFLLDTCMDHTYLPDSDYKIETAGKFTQPRLDYFEGVKRYLTNLGRSFKNDFLTEYVSFSPPELLPVFFRFVLFHKEELDKMFPPASPIDSLLEQERKKYNEPGNESKDREMKKTVTNADIDILACTCYQNMLFTMLDRPEERNIFLNEENVDILFELLDRDMTEHCFEICQMILDYLDELSYESIKNITDRVADLLTKKIYQLHTTPGESYSRVKELLKFPLQNILPNSNTEQNLFRLLAIYDKPDHLSLIYNRIIDHDLALLSPAKSITEVAMVNNSWAFLERLFALVFDDKEQIPNPDMCKAFGDILARASLDKKHSSFAIKMLQNNHIPINEDVLIAAISDTNVNLTNETLAAIAKNPQRYKRPEKPCIMHTAFQDYVGSEIVEELFKDQNINFVRNNLPDEKSMVQFLERDESENFSDSQIILLQNWEKLGLDTACLAPFMQRLTINDIAKIFFTDENHFAACPINIRRQIINEIVKKNNLDDKSIAIPKEITDLVTFKKNLLRCFAANTSSTRSDLNEKKNTPMEELQTTYNSAVFLLQSKEMDNDNKQLVLYWFVRYTNRFENTVQIISLFNIFAAQINNNEQILNRVFNDCITYNNINEIKMLFKLMLSDEFFIKFKTPIEHVTTKMQEDKEHPDNQFCGNLIRLYLSCRELKKNAFAVGQLINHIKSLIDMTVFQKFNHDDLHVQNTIAEIQTLLLLLLRRKNKSGINLFRERGEYSESPTINSALEALKTAFGEKVLKSAVTNFINAIKKSGIPYKQ